MAIPPLPEPCWDCANYIGVKRGGPDELDEKEPIAVLVCKAFPDGIPEEIQSGSHTHRSAFEGDGDLRWEGLEKV